MRIKSKIQKLQSAMEYLVTYGWAILIVAVVICLLFSLGLFGNAQYTSFVCLAEPPFLCSNPVMSSSGALSIRFGYAGASPITLTGLVCSITSSTKPPSEETTQILVIPNQQMTLTFQCPITSQAQIGTTIPVNLWFYYSISSFSGLQQQYARGIVKVGYTSLVWNVIEWTPSSNAVNLLPYGWVASNPEQPSNTIQTGSTAWSSLIAGGQEGWSYSTDYHNHDVYNGIETTLFPISPLSLDTAPCSAPYDAHAYTATTHATMSGTYTFSTVTDDATEIFYRAIGSSTWQSVYSSNAWLNQPPTAYSQTLSLPANTYELAVDFMDTCDPAGLSVVLISPLPTPA